jgi:hypothetical protein
MTDRIRHAAEELPPRGSPVPARRTPVASRLTTSVAALAVFGTALLSQAPAARAATPPSSEPSAAVWTPGSEVLSMRDRWGSTVEGATEGTYVSTIYSKPRNFQAADGSWQPIDLTVKATMGGLRPTANDLVPELALTGSASQLVDMSFAGAQRLRFGLTGALPVPAVADGTAVHYSGILPGVDARFDLRSGGVKETLVLSSADAPTSFDFPLDLSGLTAQQADDGSISLVGSDGTRVATMPAGSMSDSFVDPRSGDPAQSDGVRYQLQTGNDGSPVLHVSLDSAWLHDPARVFPVQVDPSVYNVAYSDSADDSYVQSTGGYSDTDTILKSGTFDGNDKSRSFMHFQGVNTFDGRDINSATLNVWENWSYSCTTRGVRVYPISANWVGTTAMTWPGVGVRAYSSTYVPEAVVAHGHDSGCPAANVPFNVTTTVSNWASNAWPNYGLALISTSETDAYGWKKWDSNEGSHNPSLTVNWTNTAPHALYYRGITPNDCSGCAGPAVNTKSTTPVLAASATDSDAQTVRLDFEVYPGHLTTVDANGYATPGSVARLQSGSVSGLASGATGSWTVPSALGDGDYSYRFRAYDGELYSTWSTGWGTFTVDSGPPVTPTITSNSHPSETNYYSAADIQAQWQTLITPPSGTKGYTTLLDTASGSDPGTSNPSAATSNTFTGKPDGCYYLHTRATNNVDTWSGISQRQLCVDTTPPSAPTSVTSDHTANVPSNNTVIHMNGSGASDASSGVGGYSVLFNTSATAPADTVRDVTGTAFSATSTALADGTSYYFHVRAIDLAGNAGSDVVSGPYLIDTLAPAAPTVTSSQAASGTWTPNTSVTFNWAAPGDASGISGYSAVLDDVQSTIPPASTSTTGTSLTYSGIGDGTHYFHLRALDNAGNWGSTYLFTLLVDSSAPVAPTVSSSTHPDQSQWSSNNLPSFSFSGSDLSGITGFAYVLDQSAGTVPGTTAQVTGSSGSYTAPTGLPEGLSYFHIRARNGSNLFGDTYSYVVRVDRSAPNVAPTPSSSSHQVNTPSNNQVLQVSWTGAPGSDTYSGIGGYSVVVNTASGTAADTTQDQTGTTFAANLPSDGSYYFHIRALDKVGNVGPDTVLGPFVLDLTGPAAPTITSTTHTDGAWSTNPNATFALASTDASGISGYSVVFDESAGTIPPQTVTTTTGVYSKNGITDGTHYLHVRAKDVTGNWGGTALFTVLVDSTAPVAPTATSSTHPDQSVWSSDNNPGISFTGADTSGITGFSFAWDRTAGTVPDTTPELTGSSAGTATATGLADGLNYFHVRARNGSGLFGATTTYLVKVDRSAPNVAPTVTSSSHQVNSPSNNTTLALNWAGAPGADAYSGVAGYSIAINTASATPADSTMDLTGTSSSFALPGEGSYYVHIRAIDAVGNVGPDTVTGPFVIDLTAPAAPVIGSSDHTQTDWSASPTATFSWPAPVDPSGIGGYAVLVDQTVATVPPATVNASTASWTASGLPEGVSYLHVRAKDLAGNWGQPSSFVLHIDLTAPGAPTITSSTHPTPGAWSTDNNPRFAYTGTDLSGIAGYAYTLDQTAGTDPATTVQDTTGTATGTNLADGSWYLHVRGINGAGLAGAVATYAIGVDRSAPSAPTITSLSHEPNVITDHRVVTADWTDLPAVDPLSGVAGYSVAINNDPATPAGISVDVPGTQYTGASLADGTYWLHVRGIDNVGNVGPDASYGPILIDATHGLPYPVQDVVASASAGVATVAWSPADNNGSGLLGYTVVSDPDGLVADVPPGETSVDIPGLTDGIVYTFTVVAHNANGDGLPSDPSDGVTSVESIDPVSDVQAEEVDPGNALHVWWLAPALKGNGDALFTVVLSPGGWTQQVSLVHQIGDDGSGGEPSTDATFTGLPAGTYVAQVTAAGDDGIDSAPVSSDPVVVRGLVPAPPAGLTASPGDTDVTLSWLPSVDNGSPITQYEVVVNGDETAIQYVDGSDTTTVVSGLANGTLATFNVYATNDLGRSPTSSAITATPFDAGNMAAVNATTASNVRATRGDKSARLTWTAPKVFVAGTTKYQITSHPNSGASKTWVVAASPATVSGLTNGVPVSFTVATYGTSTAAGPVTGPESNPSNRVTPAGLPDPPTGVTAANLNAAIELKWTTPSNNGDAIKHYRVQIYDGGSYLSERVVGSSPQKLSNLTYGHNFTFTVKAENGVGVGRASAMTRPAVTSWAVPDAPGNPVATRASEHKIHVTWSAAANNGTPITKYVVATTKGNNQVTTSATATSADLDGVDYGNYNVRIVAYSKAGKSRGAITNEVELSGLPSAPSHLTATAGQQRVTLNWSGARDNGTGVTHYIVSASPGPYLDTLDGDARSYTFSSLNAGQSYTFFVHARNANGDGPNASVSATPTSASSPNPPTQPSGGKDYEKTLRAKLASLARGQDNESGSGHARQHESPTGGNCNWFTAYWHRNAPANGTGVVDTTAKGKAREPWNHDPCDQITGPGNVALNSLSENWCSDFAEWVYKTAGVNVSHADAAAAHWLVDEGGQHPVTSWASYHGGGVGHPWDRSSNYTYTPQTGDLIIWQHHVEVVISYDPSTHVLRTVGGNAGPGVPNTDSQGYYSENNVVVDYHPITRNTNGTFSESKTDKVGKAFQGFVSPVRANGTRV